jgi:hypothetical protein
MREVVILEPGRTERHYWRDLWQFRELFQVLAWRDIAVRYKQTVIGASWALIRPFLTMVIFTVIFGKLAKLPSDGAAPCALMAFAGMLPWSFFSSALADASDSLVDNPSLISKVYFPRLIVPIAAVMGAFVDFLISFTILVALMIWYQFVPGWQAVCGYRVHCEPGDRRLDYGAQRQVPGFPLRHPIHWATGPLRVSGGIQLERDTRTMASVMLHQPHGGSDRWVSLVPARRPKPALSARSRAQHRRRRLFPVAGHPPVQEDEKRFC